MSHETDRLGTVTRNGANYYDYLFERRIAKPMEKVWAAIITPERIADWFALVELEPKVGGYYRLRFAPDDAATEGVITAFDPPCLFEHTWPDGQHPDSRVRYELEPDGEGCRLRFSQIGVPKQYVGSVAGWHLFLDALPGATEGVRFVWTMEQEREVMKSYQGRIPA